MCQALGVSMNETDTASAPLGGESVKQALLGSRVFQKRWTGRGHVYLGALIQRGKAIQTSGLRNGCGDRAAGA